MNNIERKENRFQNQISLCQDFYKENQRNSQNKKLSLNRLIEERMNKSSKDKREHKAFSKSRKSKRASFEIPANMDLIKEIEDLNSS